MQYNPIVDYHITYIQRELDRRKSKNPRQSLRSFARFLKIDAGTLSRILTKKHIPSAALAARLIELLQLTPQEEEHFYRSVQALSEIRRLQKNSQRYRKKDDAPETPVVVPLEKVALMTDWYTQALLELVNDPKFQPSPEWIAEQLGIDVPKAREAFEQLQKTGLIVEEHGVYRKTGAHMVFAPHVMTHEHLRKGLAQFMAKAQRSLENDPPEERIMANYTAMIDPAMLPVAKQMLNEFITHLCKHLETGNERRLYNLVLGFYPLQKKND